MVAAFLCTAASIEIITNLAAKGATIRRTPN